MIEWLESIDRSIVLAVNSIHMPWLDELMWLVSGKFFWIPFYLFLLFLAYKKYGLLQRRTIWICIFTRSQFFRHGHFHWTFIEKILQMAFSNTDFHCRFGQFFEVVSGCALFV